MWLDIMQIQVTIADYINPWGRKTCTLLYILHELERPLTAGELEEITGIDSREVFPYLKHWINKGVVIVRRIGERVYEYTINGKWRKALRRALERAKKRKQVQLEIALKQVEDELSRKLEPTERELVLILLQRSLSESSSYIRIPAPSIRDGVEKLKEIIYDHIKDKVKSPELAVEHLPGQLADLKARGIIYIAHVTRGQTGPELIIKLDKTIETKIRQALKHLQS